jgi:hypothetical protein
MLAVKEDVPEVCHWLFLVNWENRDKFPAETF